MKFVRVIKIVAAGLVACALIVALGASVVFVKRLLEINDEIDRCHDDGSSRYIKDDQARAEACRQ